MRDPRPDASPPTPVSLDDRLAALEARLSTVSVSCARWRRFGAAGLLGLAVVVLTAQAPGSDRSFVVRDDAGRARAQLGMSADGTPALSLYDEEGHLRAALAVTADGPMLDFYGPDGTPRIVVGERAASAFVILRDHEGAPRAAMAIQEDGEPSLYLLDDTLTPLWRKP